MMSLYMPDNGKGLLEFQVCVRKTMRMLVASYNVKRFVWVGVFNADIHGTDSEFIGRFTTMRFGHEANTDKEWNH